METSKEKPRDIDNIIAYMRRICKQCGSELPESASADAIECKKCGEVLRKIKSYRLLDMN